MTWYSKTIAACALLILACSGALSFLSEVRSEKDREWVRHTYIVVEDLQEVRIDITQAETGQRVFMRTGRARHMEMYSTGVKQVRQDLSELADLIADNPAEREAIQRLNVLITERLAELGEELRFANAAGLWLGSKQLQRRLAVKSG